MKVLMPLTTFKFGIALDIRLMLLNLAKFDSIRIRVNFHLDLSSIEYRIFMIFVFIMTLKSVQSRSGAETNRL